MLPLITRDESSLNFQGQTCLAQHAVVLAWRLVIFAI